MKNTGFFSQSILLREKSYKRYYRFSKYEEDHNWLRFSQTHRLDVQNP